MLIEILLAIIQGITEFLPISSSGHLALISNIISTPNLAFFTMLHFASLLAVIIFMRKEIIGLISFNSKYKKLWIYWIIATIPAGLIGWLFKDIIEKSLSSFIFLGGAFIFTGLIIIMTKFFNKQEELGLKHSLIIGLMQILALFPGISRSGITISFGIFSGLKKEIAMRFSFLLFIPLSIGATALELNEVYFDYTLLISFIVCFIVSLMFLKLLRVIINKEYFWIFGIYCLIIGIVSVLWGIL